MARRTKEEAAATRELLLNTAETMFLQHGVARTSLNDIACAAGLTRGAVYWHFEDKAALYNALMDRFSSECSILEGGPLPEGLDAVAAVRMLAMMPVQMMRQDPRVRRLFTIAMHRVEFSDDVAAIWQRHVSKGSEYVAVLTAALTAAQAQGLCRLRLPVGAAARGLFALVNGLIFHATLDPSQTALLEDAEPVINAYLTGLGCPPP